MTKDICDLECQRCALHLTRTNVVKGKGSLKAKILGLGEAPGGDEDKEGFCFVGKAGTDHLEPILQYAGLKWYPEEEANIWLDNPVRCRPVKEEFGKLKNDKPTAIHLSACSIFTFNLIEEMQPKLIICFGVIPADYFAELASAETGIEMGWDRGTIFHYKGIPVLPLYHPAFFIYNPTMAQETWSHIDRNRKLINSILSGDIQ